MQIVARIVSSSTAHHVTVRTGDSPQLLTVARKAEGAGSSVNGGEFLVEAE